MTNEKTLEQKFEDLGCEPSVKGILPLVIFGWADIDFISSRMHTWNLNEPLTYVELGIATFMGTIATLGGIAAYYDIKKSRTGKYPKNKVLNKLVYGAVELLSHSYPNNNRSQKNKGSGN